MNTQQAMSKHTKEPWAGKEILLTSAGLARAGFSIVFTNHPATRDEAEANARRIVASVNACAGIPTDVLEVMPSGSASLLPMYAQIEQQRDKLLAPPKLSDERILELWANNSGRPVTMGKARIIAQARSIEKELLGENK